MKAEELKKLEEEYKKSPGSFDVPFEQLIRQIAIFEKGVPYIHLKKPAVIGDGILRLNEENAEKFRKSGEAQIAKGRAIKFVPASGAASRMFKKLQACLDANQNMTNEELKDKAFAGDIDCKDTYKFVSNIKKFAFKDELSRILKENGIENPKWTEIVKFVVNEEGLDYSNNPKGSILFHKYPDYSRTAFEEHLVEGINYAMNSKKEVKIHFTISPEHEKLFNAIIKKFVKSKNKDQIKFDVKYSFQKKSTNTVAVTKDNKIFRDENGKSLFRPAGHGALLENLNDLEADIILIKNIDNVSHDSLKEETYKYKKALVGILSEIQNKTFRYLKLLEREALENSIIEEIKIFAETELFQVFEKKFDSLESDKKNKVLFDKLNRPIRICGMVKNEGEPGGGPFWVENNGQISLQVVEAAQINLNDSEQKKIFNSSTHFSPVDFICGVKDYKGNNFNLNDFSDLDTALITTKSKDGKELKALELPGLWNGGMAKWISIFVEVPLITFNPVKEVNDLLKPAHQPE